MIVLNLSGILKRLELLKKCMALMYMSMHRLLRHIAFHLLKLWQLVCHVLLLIHLRCLNLSCPELMDFYSRWAIVLNVRSRSSEY